MRACRLLCWTLLVMVASSAIADSAFAQSKKRKRPPQPTEEPAPEPEPEPEPIAEEEPLQESGWDTSNQEEEVPPSDEGAAHADEGEAEAGDADAEPDLTSPPNWWFGPFLRGVWVPSFMLGLFLDDPPTIANPSFGVTATHRSDDGFSLVIGIGYTGYGFEGPLQKSGDPDQDTEWVESNLGLVHLTGQMLWSSQVHEMLAIEYGFGVDLGIVTGDLTRWEAYRDPNGDYKRCTSAGMPFAPVGGEQYCEFPETLGAATDAYDEFGAHYGVKEERVPPIALIPMIPLVALRFTPIRELAIKLEASYGIFQFTFGVSAAYGVDL
jgi:hypothetical protein